MVLVRLCAYIGRTSHLGWQRLAQRSEAISWKRGGLFPYCNYCNRSCSTANNVAPTLVLTPTLL